MDLAGVAVEFLQLHLLAVHRLAEVVYSLVVVVEEHFHDFPPRRSVHILFFVGIIRLGGKVVPQLGGDEVSHSEKVRLTGIQHPAVVSAKAEKLEVVFLALLVHETQLVVSLVLVGLVGGVPPPFHLGQQLLLPIAGHLEGDGAERLLVAKLPLEVEDGQGGEFELSTHQAVATHGRDRIGLPGGHSLEGHEGVHRLVVDLHIPPGGVVIQGHPRLPVLAPLLVGQCDEEGAFTAVIASVHPIDDNLPRQVRTGRQADEKKEDKLPHRLPPHQPIHSSRLMSEYASGAILTLVSTFSFPSRNLSM